MTLGTQIRILVKQIKRGIFGFSGNYYYGDTAHNYEEVRIKQESWHQENQVVADILKELPKGMSILDVPFGTGRFLPLYFQHQMKVTGLDISYDMLAKAKDLRLDLTKQCQLDVGNATQLPYADQSFDVVLSFRFLDGILSFKDQKKALSELVRVTRKYLILEVLATSNENDSTLVLDRLSNGQPVNGRLSEIERKKFLETYGIHILKRISLAIEPSGLRSVVYLCQKNSS